MCVCVSREREKEREGEKKDDAKGVPVQYCTLDRSSGTVRCQEMEEGRADENKKETRASL